VLPDFWSTLLYLQAGDKYRLSEDDDDDDEEGNSSENSDTESEEETVELK